jgi:nicotinamide phosphoribosyltransferase
MGDGFNTEGWDYIYEKHHGKLPLYIRAVPEGTKVPIDNVLMTVEVTDPKCFWLTTFVETLLEKVWYPSTVATVSHYVRSIIKEGLEKSGDLAGLDFKLHDFGYRGVSSEESAGLGGMAHLLNFKGTDTMAALLYATRHYDAPLPCSFSINASEHSVMTSWGGASGEVDSMENILNKFPTGLVACVSDSYDIERACLQLWGEKFKDKILARNGTLVVRPDSGHVVESLLSVLDMLGQKFGTTKNEKGYKVLPPQLRVIQGDGCAPHTIKEAISALLREAWSIDNVAFGMGGGLLQKLNRDTQRFAYKCSAITVNGEERDVFKAPKGEEWKRSKAGRLSLVFRDGKFQTIKAPARDDLLIPVFKNGEILMNQKWDDVRSRLHT